jgi:hypothetical protein
VRREADVAGFHVLPGDRLLLGMLRATRDVPLRFLRRSQGLILPRGNPRRVRTLADVARKGLRFVNRQPGSGTRLLLDQLLERVGLRPADVDGYANEEFTHAAVAATVAAGKADARRARTAARVQARLRPAAEEDTSSSAGGGARSPGIARFARCSPQRRRAGNAIVQLRPRRSGAVRETRAARRQDDSAVIGRRRVRSADSGGRCSRGRQIAPGAPALDPRRPADHALPSTAA